MPSWVAKSGWPLESLQHRASLGTALVVGHLESPALRPGGCQHGHLVTLARAFGDISKGIHVSKGM